MPLNVLCYDLRSHILRERMMNISTIDDPTDYIMRVNSLKEFELTQANMNQIDIESGSRAHNQYNKEQHERIDFSYNNQLQKNNHSPSFNNRRNDEHSVESIDLQNGEGKENIAKNIKTDITFERGLRRSETIINLPFDRNKFRSLFKFWSSEIELNESCHNRGFYQVSTRRHRFRLNLFVRYLDWSYETSFWVYFVSAVLIYFILVFLFAFVFMSLALMDDPCISGYPIDSNLNRFTGAMALSWTTFSTVGYGQIYPQIEHECSAMNFLAALESFIGVLYAGLCCAITFGKVQQYYSRARVAFSSACVIKYGDGLKKDEGDRDVYAPRRRRNIKDKSSFIDNKETSYPVLTFRVVNEYANHNHGSISNLNVNVVVVNEVSSEDEDESEPSHLRHYNHTQIEPNSVPLFDRVINIRHTLDEDSPLLKEEMRRMMEENDRKWPASIDTATAIRSSIDFEQIIVSLEGISDLNKSVVYARKIYSMKDVKIGWQFVDMSFGYKNKNSKVETQIDFDLLDFVVEQTRGGGERLDR